MSARLTGTIVRLISEKGFGFVQADDGAEYFFHRSAMNPLDFVSLVVGETVTFTPDDRAPKGPRAEQVERV